MECTGIYEIMANVNFMVSLERRIETIEYYNLNRERKNSLGVLSRSYFNRKCALYSTSLYDHMQCHDHYEQYTNKCVPL